VGRRQVLADVVGSDRELAVPAVDEHGELDARRAAVVEEGIDRGPDRPARVEDVVAEDAGHALEREVEPRGAHDRLRVEGRAGVAYVHVVAVKGDVEGPERDLAPAELLDEAPEPLGQRDAARVDADEGGALEVRVALHDLVRDARNRAPQRLAVEQELVRLCRRSHEPLLSGLTGPG
jgi:hypothetical protein